MATKSKVLFAPIKGENAFGIVGNWSHAAKNEGWTPEEIQAVMDEAFRAASYDELVEIIESYSFWV